MSEHHQPSAPDRGAEQRCRVRAGRAGAGDRVQIDRHSQLRPRRTSRLGRLYRAVLLRGDEASILAGFPVDAAGRGAVRRRNGARAHPAADACAGVHHSGGDTGDWADDQERVTPLLGRRASPSSPHRSVRAASGSAASISIRNISGSSPVRSPLWSYWPCSSYHSHRQGDAGCGTESGGRAPSGEFG